MYYRMFATGAAIEGSATIAGYSMNNTAMLLDTRDVLTHRTLVDPHVKVEMGKAGSCEFTILPTHTLYDKLKRMVTFITVEEIDPDINHDIVLFKGRIVELETDLYGQKKVTCEGDLAYLGDSYTPPLASKNTVVAVPRYFEEIITQHNGQVEAAKQFTVGDTSAFSGVEDKFSESSYQNSSRALEDLIEYHGGYLRTRHNGGTTYLDYVKDTATPGRAVPRVEFAKNLVDFTEKVSAEDIFTVLIPLGDKTDTGEGTYANSVPLTLTPPKLNVDDVIQGANAISTFGYILRAETFSGVKDAVTLRQRAEAYIRANYNALPEEFTVKAIDLRYLDDTDAQVPFEVGENITIVVPVRGVSKTLKCLSIQYDLFNPDATEIEVGTGKQEIRQRSLTDQQAQTDAKSKSSAKSAKANTAATEYLTWKDVKEAKEINLTAQKINLLNDASGGTFVETQGKITFAWSNNGLYKKVTDVEKTAGTAKSTADTAKSTADDNADEIANHGLTLWGNGKSYSDWQASVKNARAKTLLDICGDLYADNGIFKNIVIQEQATGYWAVINHINAVDITATNDIVANHLTVRRGTNSSGQDIAQFGGPLQEENEHNKRPYFTVDGSGTTYVKDIRQFDINGDAQSVVTHPEYPLLSIKTIDNKKYLVAGADTKGADGYSLNVQKVALDELLGGENLANYAQLNTDVTFGTVTGSSFALPGGTNSQGQPNNPYTFTKHYITMDDVAKIAVGGTLPYYLGESDLDLSHSHEIEFTEVKDSNNKSTGQYRLTLKKAVKRKAQTDGETATFNIASTKFFQDAIAGASVYSIAYDGASNENPAMSVGTKTISGTSAQVKVLNNVPLMLTFGTEAGTQTTGLYKVSGVELPSVSLQNGSGGTPAITYVEGRPTIDVKAVMKDTTVKSTETYTGNAVTLRPSFTAPSASEANKTFTLEAYNGTTISDKTRITSKDVTLEHAIGQITSDNKKYLRVRTNAKNDSSESSSQVFYTDYQITWNSDSIQNTNGSSSVTAKVSINGVQYDTHTFTGTYATADSDNETVRANGWAAALAALEDNDPPASGTLGFSDRRTVNVYQKSQESDTALTTYLTRTYTAPSEPYSILTPKYYGNALSAKMKVDAALNSKSDGTGTAYTHTASKTIELSGSAVTLAAKTGSATIVAKVDGTTYAEQSVSITAPNPVISVNTDGITEKSNKLPVSASLGTTTGLGSKNLEFTVSGGDTIANGPGDSVVQFKYGDKVISEKTVSATYATADSDNETVRADGWAAALNALNYAAPSSETLDFGEAKTVYIQKRATEGDALTDIFRRTYTAPDKPTINAPTLNTGTINYTTKSVQGGTQFYVQAPIKVTTSVANLGSTGTVDVPIGATVDNATIIYDATTGKPTVTANVKVAGINDKYIATKTFEGAAPTATLSAGTITEKSGKLPILAKMGNVQIGSGDFSIAMSGSDIGNFAVANEEQTTTIQAKYGNYVLAEKVVKAKYTGNAAATVSDIVNNGNAYLDGSNLKVPAKAIDSSENTLKTANVQVGAISVVGDGGKITEYGQSKKVSFKISGQEIASGTVTAEYPMSVSSTALSSASIALNSRDELFYITANQTITLGDNASDTTHPLYFPWYTGQYKTYGDDGNSGYGTVIVTAKSGSSASESSQTTVSTNKTYVHPVLTKGSNIPFNNNSDVYDSYVNVIAREVDGTTASASTVRQLAKETFVISSKAIGVANSTNSTLYALSTAQLGDAVGSGTTYSHRIWSIGHVDALAEAIADEPESFNIVAKASASNVTTGKASTKMTLLADSLRIDPGSTTTVKAMIGTTEYASIDIEAKTSSAGDLSTVEASFSDPTRTNIDTNGTYYASTIKAVASSNGTVINESAAGAITATYGVATNSDKKLYAIGVAKFNNTMYARNGDWIANLDINNTPAGEGSDYDFNLTSSVVTNGRCSAGSGITLCSVSIPMWISASNATLNPGQSRDIPIYLYGMKDSAQTTFASKTIRITCSGGGGSGGSDANDLQTGWDAAVGKMSIPHGLSTNQAEFKISYPTDVYDTSTNVYYKLSQSGSMAYVKDRADNIVAQLSLTGAGGSSSGSPEDGWNAAIRRLVLPNWAGSGSSFMVTYPAGSYTLEETEGRSTRTYTITQSGSNVYVTTKNASNQDVNVAVKAVDVSAGWTAAKNVTTYPTNANSGSDTISITAPKAATYMNDTVNYDTIQYKLVQSGNNVYLQNQTTMTNVAGKQITQSNIVAGAPNIGVITADGQQHTVNASDFNLTHMTSITYTAPAKPSHGISREFSGNRSSLANLKAAAHGETYTWEQIFSSGVGAKNQTYGILVKCGTSYKGYYFYT